MDTEDVKTQLVDPQRCSAALSSTLDTPQSPSAQFLGPLRHPGRLNSKQEHLLLYGRWWAEGQGCPDAQGAGDGEGSTDVED